MIKPLLKAIILCDLTIAESGTHKRSLIGIFDRISTHQFPVLHPSMSIYVQFREIEGTFDFTLELVDLADERVMNKAVAKAFRVSGRSRDSEIVFNLMNVRFEHAGDYEFRIFVDDTVFGQKHFAVLQEPPAPK